MAPRLDRTPNGNTILVVTDCTSVLMGVGVGVGVGVLMGSGGGGGGGGFWWGWASATSHHILT